MDLEIGATVRVPGGKLGTLLQEKVHDALHFYDSTGRSRHLVVGYPVLLEEGEIRFYSERALLDANDIIRRSGTLE